MRGECRANLLNASRRSDGELVWARWLGLSERYVRAIVVFVKTTKSNKNKRYSFCQMGFNALMGVLERWNHLRILFLLCKLRFDKTLKPSPSQSLTHNIHFSHSIVIRTVIKFSFSRDLVTDLKLSARQWMIELSDNILENASFLWPIILTGNEWDC